MTTPATAGTTGTATAMSCRDPAGTGTQKHRRAGLRRYAVTAPLATASIPTAAVLVRTTAGLHSISRPASVTNVYPSKTASRIAPQQFAGLPVNRPRDRRSGERYHAAQRDRASGNCLDEVTHWSLRHPHLRFATLTSYI